MPAKKDQYSIFNSLMSNDKSDLIRGYIRMSKVMDSFSRDHSKENFQKALGAMEGMTKEHPNFYLPYFFSAVALYCLGEYEKCEKLTCDIHDMKIGAQPYGFDGLPMADIVFLYAGSLHHLGKTKKAREMFREGGISRQVSLLAEYKEIPMMQELFNIANIYVPS
ncbi:hypothetical protein HYV44_03725 [Candidatus Microgenomates bacterium]|nr:hypothetical protein [Candidatus Microgenomates bacterium]